MSLYSVLSGIFGANLARLWGGTVSSSSWTEEVGGFHAVQATSARQPTAITTVAGNGALSFSPDGSFSSNADVMVAPAGGTSATPRFTFAFGICKVEPGFGNDGNGCVLFQIGTGGAGGIVYIFPALSNALRAAGFGSTAFAYGAAPINDGAFHTWAAEWDVLSRTVTIWIDKSQGGADAPPVSSNNIDLSSMPCLFGATDTNGVAVYQGGLGCIGVAQGSSSFAGNVDAVHQALLDFTRTVQYGSAGAVAQGTTSLSVAYPSGIAAGDMLVLGVVNKYPTNGPTTPSGWTLGAQASGGAGTAGADAGTVYSTVFYKIADGTESGSLAVTITSGNSAIGRMLRYAKPSGYSWDTPTATGGSKNSAGAAFSVTGAGGISLAAGDAVIAVAGTNTDARTYSAEAVSASGVTLWEGAVEHQDSATANGDDCALVVSEHAVITGTSSSAPTFTMTASGTTASQNAGAAVLLRLRASASAGGALSGSVPIAVTFAGVLRGVGSLAGAVPIAISPSGTIAGLGALAGAVPIAIAPSGALAGLGALAGSIPMSATFAGALGGVGALAGAVPIAIVPSGALVGRGALAGAVPLSLSPAAVLSGVGALAGSLPIAIGFAGELSGVGALVATMPLELTFDGVLRAAGSGALAGAVPIGLSFSGTLRGIGSLVGTVPLSVTPSGVISAQGSLVGTVPLELSFLGQLEGTGELVGSVPISLVFLARSGESRPIGGVATVVPIVAIARARAIDSDAVVIVLPSTAQLVVIEPGDQS